jgi:CBS domain-containing protein
VTVKRILQDKGTHAPTVVPDAIITDVIEGLESEDVGALVVSANGTSIDGIITERDVVRGLQLYGPNVLEHTVRDIMTTDVFVCAADDPVAGVMALMDLQNIRHVPVVDHGKLSGIVSIRDIIKLRLGEVQSEADAMREYIGGVR